MKYLSLLTAGAVILFLAACGKNETLDRQASQRDTLGPELQGVWASNCENSHTYSAKVESDQITLEQTAYAEPECTTRLRTVREPGKYALAHNFKEGFANSIIFVPDNNLNLTLHTDHEVDLAESVRKNVVNNEKETDILEKEKLVGHELSTEERSALQRSNNMIRETKALTAWVRDQEKSLDRLQLEKLQAESSSSFSDVHAVAEQLSRLSIKYEVDNGFLQLSNAGDFSRVFHKQ